jgi:hypothetical protein
MQFVKEKPPETQYATRPGARAKRQEVALGRPGFEPGGIARIAEFKAIPRPICSPYAHFLDVDTVSIEMLISTLAQA